MTLNPRRGQFLVYDKQSSSLVSRILLPIPTKQTKGMLVAPTIFGNLLAGPTAEDLPTDYVGGAETTADGLAAVRASAAQMCPALADQPVIATYAGLRCNCAEGSYWLRFNDGAQGVVTLAGIRSTGLTASISIAQYVIDQMSLQCGLPVKRRPNAIDERPETRWPGWWRRPFEDSERTATRPDYGDILCSCENISRGEIHDALELCAGVATLDGLKRRTRVLTGRCQGFNCCVPTAAMISAHFDVPLDCVTKRGPGSEFIAKGELRPRQSLRSSASTGALKTRRQVVIIGAGPAGIGAAVELSRLGINDVLLVDRADRVGGLPSIYDSKPGGIPTFVWWRSGRIVFGGQLALRLKNELAQTKAEVQLGTQVLHVDGLSRSVVLVNPALGKHEVLADAIVFASGAREASSYERGWIVGSRPARQFNTMQVLQLLDGYQALPAERPTVIGSDLIAYSAAAKLSASGAACSIMMDKRSRPSARWFERLYFRRWFRQGWQSIENAVSISGDHRVTEVRHGSQEVECDGLVICGQLVPNSELMVASGVEVSSLDRVPRRRNRHELSMSGLYVAGAATGGFHSAEWCYRDGKGAARAVHRLLKPHR
jgi:L-2-hydroxyglutarate oxidase LhgO